FRLLHSYLFGDYPALHSCPTRRSSDLALGLGSREIAGQILAGIYVRELYEVGQDIQVGDIRGQIEEIGTVKTVLLTQDDQLVSIANKTLLEHRVDSRCGGKSCYRIAPRRLPAGAALSPSRRRSALNKVQHSGQRYHPRELSDEELVARAHQELFHVTRAYEELMRRYQRTLFNVCARYLGNERDADDVCQEVMLKVLYGLKNFEGKSKFKTWLYSI